MVLSRHDTAQVDGPTKMNAKTRRVRSLAYVRDAAAVFGVPAAGRIVEEVPDVEVSLEIPETLPPEQHEFLMQTLKAATRTDRAGLSVCRRCPT